MPSSLCGRGAFSLQPACAQNRIRVRLKAFHAQNQWNLPVIPGRVSQKVQPVRQAEMCCMEVFTNWVAGSCSSAIPKIASSTQFSAPVPHLGQEMLSGLGGSLAA